jgi:hypothetical protein
MLLKPRLNGAAHLSTVHFLIRPTTHIGGDWGKRRYSSYSFLTLAIDAGEWSASFCSCSLPSGKGLTITIVQEAGWASEPLWTQRQEEKSFACRGSNPSPATHHGGDWVEGKYSSYSFLTLALVEVKCQHHTIVDIYPGEGTPSTN